MLLFTQDIFIHLPSVTASIFKSHGNLVVAVVSVVEIGASVDEVVVVPSGLPRSEINGQILTL